MVRQAAVAPHPAVAPPADTHGLVVYDTTTRGFTVNFQVADHGWLYTVTRDLNGDKDAVKITGMRRAGVASK